MEKQFADSDYEAASKAITAEPTLVYWIYMDLVTSGGQGIIYIRDGFDAKAEIRFKVCQSRSRQTLFIPPIRCALGLYVEKDTGVTSYTVGYRRERELSGG